MRQSEEAWLTWRYGRSPALRRRRWIAALGALGLAADAVAIAVGGRRPRPVATLLDALPIVLAGVFDLPTRRRSRVWSRLLTLSTIASALPAILALRVPRPRDALRLAVVPLALPEIS